MTSQPIPTRPDLHQRDPEHYTKLDTFEHHLIRTIKLIAAYECPEHNPKAPCSCSKALATFPPKTKDLFTYIHFVQAWEQHLLSHDAAFIFTDTYQGKQVFAALTSQTPSSFAIAFAVRTFAPGMLVPATHLESTIIAMLAFWDDRASSWKSKYPNTEVARRDLKACMPTDQGHELYGRELKDTPAGHQLGQGILIPQRLVRNPPGDTEKEHGNTFFLLPLLPRVDGSSFFLRHKLLGLRRCHENCFHTPPALTQAKIEDFRRSCSKSVAKVAWEFDDSQHRILDVDHTDPVDGAA